MQFERDLWRRFGRNTRANALAHAERIELLDATALSAETSQAGLVAHQAAERQRAPRLLEYAFMLREIARRTGDLGSLANAGRTAERAVKVAADDATRIAARIELAHCSLLAADLFGDTLAADTVEVRLSEIEAEGDLAVEDRIVVLGLKARLLARNALADNDLTAAVEAAGAFDEAVELSDQRLRSTGDGQALAASLRLHRAQMLVGFGTQLKEISLLRQAETDLGLVAVQVDRDRLPITWAQAEALRGAAMAACGAMTGDEDEISRGASVLGASIAHLPALYSPLDTARTSHAMGVALMALGEACDDDRLFDEAITSFDLALEPFEASPEIAQRPVCAYDRATAITRRAQRRGDLNSLDYAERAFKAELSGLAASLDPVAWAVVQVALARVYSARADMTGHEDQRARASLALSAALDVFTERGLRSLAEVVMTDLDRIRVRV
jgi:tetratricopeptide (TPR) repeat protein